MMVKIGKIWLMLNMSNSTFFGLFSSDNNTVDAYSMALKPWKIHMFNMVNIVMYYLIIWYWDFFCISFSISPLFWNLNHSTAIK